MITAKVVSLDKQTKRDGGDKGITYFNVMTMDNWEVISIGKKKENAFKAGDSIEYEHKDDKADEYGVWKAKEASQPWSWGKWGYQKDYGKEAITMCLAYGKDLVIAGKIEEKQLIKTAERFHDWVLERLAK